MDKSTVGQLAERLTEPQRLTVLALSERPAIATRGGFSPVAAFNLIREGVTRLGFHAPKMRDTYCLTRRGVMLKAVLRAKVRGDTPQCLIWR